MTSAINHKKKILIAGPVAPPAGGISIHIQRLVHLLNHNYAVELIDESHSIKPGIFNIRSLNIFRYILLLVKCDLIFIHSGNRFFKKLHILSSWIIRKKIIITIHGYGNKRNWMARSWDAFFFNGSDAIILVNHLINDKLKLDPSKILIQHAFLPPVMEEEPLLHPAFEKFLKEEHSEGKTLICANASELKSFNGEDLYGLDLCLQTTQMLVKQGKSIRFIFNVTQPSKDNIYYNQATEFIKIHNLEANFTLMNEEISFVRLMEHCDIMIRPTHTDGDSLSVREAIHLGKTVICSDVVPRPDPCILFRNRDLNDLVSKTNQAIQLLNQESISNTKGKPIHSAEHYETFYGSLIDSIINSDEN